MKSNVTILAIIALVIGVGFYFYFSSGVDNSKTAPMKKDSALIDTNPSADDMAEMTKEKAEEGIVDMIKDDNLGSEVKEEDAKIDNLDEDLNLDDLDEEIDSLNI